MLSILLLLTLKFNMVVWYIIFSILLVLLISHLFKEFVNKTKSRGKTLPPLVKQDDGNASPQVMLRQNANSYLSECKKIYGDVFSIDMGQGLFQTYLFDVPTFAQVLHSKKMGFLPISTQSKRRFGLKKSLQHLELLTKVLKSSLRAGRIDDIMSDFERQLGDAFDAFPTRQTQMTLFADLISKTILKAASNSLYGKELYYDNFGKDFAAFDLGVAPRFAGSGPNILTSPTGKCAMENLKSAISKSIPSIYKQSKFMRVVKQEFVDVVLDDEQDKEEEISLLLLLIWGAFNNFLPTTFWLLSHVTSSPAAVSTILNEMDISTGGDTDVSENLRSLQKTHAIIQEILRFRARPNILRVALEDVDLEILGKLVTIPKGHWVALFPKLLYFDEQVFNEADKFRYNRFFSVNDKFPDFFKNGKQISERIIRSLLVFGDGRFRCPAYDLMNGIMKIIIGVTLQKVNVIMHDVIPESLQETVSSVPGPVNDANITVNKRN